ncbi:hypothetical protein AB7M16_005092 [Bradyrhizobium sp. USDA 372]
MSKTREAAVHASRELPREQPMPRFDYQKPPTITKDVSSTNRATLSTDQAAVFDKAAEISLLAESPFLRNDRRDVIEQPTRPSRRQLGGSLLPF